jgi:hypothetical protein
LTLFYTDENQALHGAVVLIPKNRKEDVLRAFERVGLTPTEFSGESGADAEPLDVRGTPVNRSLPHIGRPSVILALPQSDAQPFPAAFKAGIYEELVAQTMKSGFFDRVWRQGDDRAGADALTLNLDITEFKKGNAGVRGAIPVVGMLAGKTLIRADLRLADASGAVLLDKEVKGSKRMMGESIAATKSLAQRVASSLADVPGLKKGEPSVEMASN